MSRYALSVKELLRRKLMLMLFEGSFKDSFGQPERAGTWLVWGDSAQGKTSLCMQLSKYMTRFGTVAYNSYEEGARMSYINQLKRYDMQTVSQRFFTLEGLKIPELKKYLARQRSADIVVMDSVQHSRITKEEYDDLKREFPRKLFVYISHAQGKLPKGETADFIRYDADLKLWVEGFRCFVSGRLNGGGEPFTIDKERADKYWSKVS